jgi:hypothetical protein
VDQEHDAAGRAQDVAWLARGRPAQRSGRFPELGSGRGRVGTRDREAREREQDDEERSHHGPPTSLRATGSRHADILRETIDVAADFLSDDANMPGGGYDWPAHVARVQASADTFR